jgi:hypothetical protein
MGCGDSLFPLGSRRRPRSRPTRESKLVPHRNRLLWRLGFPKDSGQATVEFALVLPMALLVISLGLYAVLDVRDRVLVVHSARSSARVLGSGGSFDAAVEAGKRAAPQLDERRLEFTKIGMEGPGELVGMRVTYKRPTVALLERLGIAAPTIEAAVLMPWEGP